MQYYTYTIQPGQNQPDGAGLCQTLFGISAVTGAVQTLDAQGTWPADTHSILAADMPADGGTNLDARASAWVDAAAPGQKLEVLYRGLRLAWKSGRAFVQGPEPLVAAALGAVLEYALLVKQVQTLEERAQALGNGIAAWQAQREKASDIASMRAQLAEVTALMLRLVDLRTFCELPARTGEAGPTLRLRTELLSQAQTSDALGLVEHRLEIIAEGLENRLQRAQEARRGWYEVAIGVAIIAILIVESLAP